MDLPQEIDDYIKESIDDAVGLHVSSRTLGLKLRASEENQWRLREQHLLLLSKLKEKDQVIERAKAEATMNAQALKKFVEENQKLAAECASLLKECHKWERECSLYDHDREALMDFGNEADERAKEAELRVLELEEDLGKLLEELQHYKKGYDMRSVDSSFEGTTMEENSLNSVLEMVIGNDVASARSFLEANSGHDSCQKLLKMWNCLKPSTQKVLSLIAEVKTLEKDKEHLRINLHRAEEEVKLLFEENNILDEENKKLMRKYHKERKHPDSGGKHTSSASVKSNKRKPSPKRSNLIDRKIDFDDVDSARQPLSPLQCNSRG
ncbi:Centlein like [Quillaja saponaria]|uniref:Centlein like n=1 Tax=Quillaja saponaria TaxID=32244 RepID=A0AAD7PLC6_QUISA|nr:Centlein like [Quillaja saponaria]